MLQCGGNIDLLGALGDPVEDHVDQDVGPRSPHAVAAVHDHRATATSVALVNFPTETEKSIRHRSAAGEDLIFESSLTQPRAERS